MAELHTAGVHPALGATLRALERGAAAWLVGGSPEDHVADHSGGPHPVHGAIGDQFDALAGEAAAFLAPLLDRP